jgi:hypothetical protein
MTWFPLCLVKTNHQTHKCRWVKSVMHAIVGHISSTATWETDQQLQEAFCRSHCSWRWHNQLLNVKGQYIFIHFTDTFRAPGWLSGLRQCISVQPAVIRSLIGRCTIGPASYGLGEGLVRVGNHC